MLSHSWLTQSRAVLGHQAHLEPICLDGSRLGKGARLDRGMVGEECRLGSQVAFQG